MVRITVDGGGVTCVTPYHRDFPDAARDMGGKWNGVAWVFDARDERRVRDLCLDLFGSDGTPCPLASVRVVADVAALKTEERSTGATLYLDGMPVASVRSRNDERARLADGVVIVAGKFYGCGSTRHPDVNWDRGTVFEVRDIPLEKAERIRASWPDLVTIIASPRSPTGPEISPQRQDLLSEREQLLARLAEIDEELAGLLPGEVTAQKSFEVADDLRDHD